ncbi:MAG: DUF2911 domain-containing protein [Roseivirga sp.]|nr:DUF2911 domain-containing protein [Roseivirga sp.]
MSTRFFIILLLVCHFSLPAQQAGSVQKRLDRLISYCKIEVPKDTLYQWNSWVTLGENTSAQVPERNEAWRRFLLSLYAHVGAMPNQRVNPQQLTAWSQFLTFPFLTGRIFDLEKHQQVKKQPDIITTSGKGDIPMLLIPPQGFNTELFEVFKQRHDSRFKFFEIAFPVGKSSFTYPQTTSYETAPWLSAVEQAIKEEVSGMDKPFYISAMGSGLYTALRIAETYPDRVKGIVSIDGQFRTRRIDTRTGLFAEPDYRSTMARHVFPLSLVIQVSPGTLANSYALTKDVARNQQYLNAISPEAVNSIFRYSQEFRTQDISSFFKKHAIPLLSFVAQQDDQSPLAGTMGVITAWQEVQNQFPHYPISLIKIADSRSLSFMDQPALFDYYFNQFIETPEKVVSPISTHTPIQVERASPAAEISQVIASTKLNLKYSRPAKKGRELFGSLIPFDQVWRAGANEATTFEASNDLLINSELLKKGRYSLFFKPGEQSWTVIFNAVPDQWGAFTYNRAFDALTLKVKFAKTLKSQEYLRYSFENLTPDGTDLIMEWGDTQVRLNIEEFFGLPLPSDHVLGWNWTELLTDKADDGVNTDMTDGKALSYVQRRDSLWFKFDLHAFPNKKAFALNLLFDTDNDQQTGSNWFGTNTAFTFDNALTLWMQKSGSGFQGLHGMMSPGDFTSNNQNLTITNNTTYYLDQDRKMYIVGFKVSDLNMKGKTLRLIGAVGEFRTWNDDIGDTVSATLQIK